MIRNVVLCKLRQGHDVAAIDALLPQFKALATPGTLGYTVGRDAGLKAGGWSFAIVADFVDAESYVAYDLDAEHNRLRDLLAPHAEDMARVQFEV